MFSQMICSIGVLQWPSVGIRKSNSHIRTCVAVPRDAGKVSHIHARKPKGKPTPERTARTNAALYLHHWPQPRR